jgi:hypothetical protein
MSIGALAYFETTALGRSGLYELFQYVAEASLKTQQKKSASTTLRRLLSRNDMRF